MRQEVLRKAPLPIHMRKGKGKGKGEDVRLIQLAPSVESIYLKAQLKIEIEGPGFVPGWSGCKYFFVSDAKLWLRSSSPGRWFWYWFWY